MSERFPALEAPDIKLATLSLWIHGREFEHADDFWDGNWLRTTARCGAIGAEVEVSGPFVRITELVDWADECRNVLAGARSTAVLQTIEPELGVSLSVSDSVGHISVVVEITPDHIHQQHKFIFEVDQSYLPDLIRSIEKLATRFPVRGSNK